MYIVRAARQPNVNTIATPHEVNAEVAAVLAQVNGGIDMENIQPDTIEYEQIRDGGQLHQHSIESYDDDELVQVRLTPQFGRLYPVPTSTGAPWVKRVSFPEDGQLRVTLSGFVTVVGGNYLFFVLLVNGELVARTDVLYANNSDLLIPYELDGVAVVPGGEVVIEAKWGFADNVAETNTSTTRDVTFSDRSLVVDWMCR